MELIPADELKSETNILIVDDRKENLISIEALLSTPGLNIHKATSGNQALGLMLEHEFAVVLLDVQMPDMDGFEVADLMKKTERTKYVPIIFMTAFSKEDRYICKGYENGAVDYLFKPLDPVVLNSKINIFLELYRQKQELERTKLHIEDQNKRLKEISNRDGLTGLYNHRYFQEILKREFSLAKRNMTDLSCLMIDLDFFKEVNDNFGHGFGDFVLKNFSELARNVVRETDVLARYGGEEFVLIMPYTGIEGARTLAEKLRQKSEEFVYNDNEHSKRVTASIGVSSFFAHYPQDPGELVAFADKALYRAKAAGRNRVHIYRQDELINIGKLNENAAEELLRFNERLEKALINSKEIILSSLESLIQSPDFILPPAANFLRNSKNSQLAIRIFDLLCERLELPPGYVLMFRRTAILHDLFKVFSAENNALKNSAFDHREKPDKNIPPFKVEELNRLFDIFIEEREILRHSNENFNGTGVPQGLAKEEIPLAARIFRLVHTFVSLISQNTLPGYSPEKTIEKLAQQGGSELDPMLVKELFEVIVENEICPGISDFIREAMNGISKCIDEE